MRTEIQDLSHMVNTLQNDILRYKNQESDKEREKNKTEKKLIRETNNSSRTLHSMNDTFTRAINNIEGNMRDLLSRFGEISIAFEGNKREVLLHIREQVWMTSITYKNYASQNLPNKNLLDK